MATVIEKPVRLVNPGRVKRRLTARQKLFFGSKRQRAAVKRTLGNGRKSKGSGSRDHGNRKMRKAERKNDWVKAYHYNKSHTIRKAKREGTTSRRLPNVGEIITIHPLINSGTKKRKVRKNKGINNPMAKTRKRRSISHVAAVKRARKAARTRARHRNPGRVSNPPVRRHRRRTHRNPVTTVTRYKVRNVGRHRRRNPGRRRVSNPGSGMFKSAIGQAIGVIGGAFVTSMAYGAVNSFTPTFSTGIMSYLAIGVIATLQGQMVGKLLKNPALGRDMTVGGFVFLALKVAADMFPGVSLGISGGRGMGNIIGPSSFWTPQVPLNGSMGTFVTPAGLRQAIPLAAPASSGPGMGNMRMMRRGGRMR